MFRCSATFNRLAAKQKNASQGLAPREGNSVTRQPAGGRSVTECEGYAMNGNAYWMLLPSFWTNVARWLEKMRSDAAPAHQSGRADRKSMTQLLGCNSEHALEVPGQMTLVGKSYGAGNFSQRTIACPCRQQRTRAVDSHLHQILMG